MRTQTQIHTHKRYANARLGRQALTSIGAIYLYLLSHCGARKVCDDDFKPGLKARRSRVSSRNMPLTKSTNETEPSENALRDGRLYKYASAKSLQRDVLIEPGISTRYQKSRLKQELTSGLCFTFPCK